MERTRLRAARAHGIDTTGIVGRRGVEGRERLARPGNRHGPGLHHLERCALLGTSVDDEVVDARGGDLGAEVVVRPGLDVATTRDERLAERLAVDVGQPCAERGGAVLEQSAGVGAEADREPDQTGLLHVLGEALDEGEAAGCGRWQRLVRQCLGAPAVGRRGVGVGRAARREDAGGRSADQEAAAAQASREPGGGRRARGGEGGHRWGSHGVFDDIPPRDRVDRGVVPGTGPGRGRRATVGQ